MQFRQRSARTHFLAGAAFLALTLGAASAHAADAGAINIAPQPLDTALNELGSLGNQQILIRSDVAAGKVAHAVNGAPTFEAALVAMLEGTGLTWRREGATYLVVSASDPQSGSAAGDGADGTVQALIVTAQRREQNIQDVPIAISAFTEKTLQEQKIEGGFDLLKAIPNVTFSKNNFSGYNFSIRGIGTKAISVATDPGVSVEFNSTPLIRNRLFEQEYFDVERVEVLRGPQGTLHGRNATAGVINVISAKPNLTEFSGWLKGEVGNYHTKRLSAMVNIPLVDDKLAVRLAGALTDRQGYDFNEGTHHAVNGRDLWSGRLTATFKPTDRFNADLVWERFNEDDNRSRTGKQLCHRDPGPTGLGPYDPFTPGPQTSAFFSQGCKPGSLYDEGAYGTPNGLSIPFILFAAASGYEIGFRDPVTYPVVGDGEVFAIPFVDPYGGMTQSHDLRTISSIKDPKYTAKADILELNVDYKLTDSLTLYSQTAYDKDHYYSLQDYNRFNTVPIFQDTSALWQVAWDPYNVANNVAVPAPLRGLTPGGVYCDPQLGCSKSIAGFDISRANSEQFSQEIRLQSDFGGAFDFSIGANYLRYRTVEDYFVLFNLMTLIAQASGPFNNSPDYTTCLPRDVIGFPAWLTLNPPAMVPLGSPGSEGCVYIDPNPVESINGEGHNYFRSKNPYRVKSWAGFGELYWRPTDALRITAGLRYTDDRKTFTPVPSQLLLAHTFLLAGTVDRGYPELPDIKQKWGEWSGRLAFDWKPDLSFTDQTLVYGSYSRGYKAGGANPPGIGFAAEGPFPGMPGIIQTLGYPKTFAPEFVNAFEVGAKNTLLGGAVVLNGGLFFYDYKDYQVSQIKERTAVNENFDAKVWGLELESVASLSPNLRVSATLGYQDSAIANGEQSIDVMDRLQGHDGYVLMKPWVQLPSNCVVPVAPVLDEIAANRWWGSPETIPDYNNLLLFCGGWGGYPINYNNGPNGGQGFYADLSGNKLPNAPHWTVSLGAQYSRELSDRWRATLRTDGYWQSQSWARVYNAVNDKLHGWYNVNLSLWVERDDGLKFELYAKNLLDKTPITDAFLNSDDSALTTNVFVLDPRLIGLSIKKDF